MPPLASCFGGREEITDFLRLWPLNGEGRRRHILVQANGQPALGFYSWDEGEQSGGPTSRRGLRMRSS